jgi:outer membrane protein OmpA-like peptidoglycan-associated protein
MGRLLLGTLLAAVCTASAPDPAAPAPVPPPAPAPREPAPREPAPSDPAIASQDACPDAPETLNGFQDGDGCPDDLPADLAAITGRVTGITFAIDKDVITLDSRPTLDRLVDVLTRHPDVALEIGVHDGEPSGSYGRCLSCRRADAIARWLVEHGIDRARVTARGYADDRPLADPRTEAGRNKNRRIELTLTGASTCTDRRTLRRPDGRTDDCYPYVCRAGACLTRCAAMTDCAGAHTRAEFPAEGWPLECMPGGQCTPMPPDKVR